MLLLRPLIRYADFKGRASRREYFGFAVFQSFWYGLLAVVGTGALGQSSNERTALGLMIVVGAMGLSAVALIVPNYAVLTRRLHDSNRGAIWLALVLPNLISALMMLGTIATTVGSVGLGASREAFVGIALTGLGAAGLFGLIGIVCNLILFVLTLLPGSPGPNRFGPDPRDPSGQINDIASVFDDDRLEDLFAQAKRERQAAEGPYKPVFDFGPGPAAPEPVARPSVSWSTSAYDPGIAPSRPFGRRAG